MCHKSITELSPEYREKARAIETRISQRLSEVTQTKICDVTGADKNKIGRVINGDLDLFAGMLATLGLTVVVDDAIYCDAAVVGAIGVMLKRAHSSPDFIRQLMVGES